MKTAIIINWRCKFDDDDDHHHHHNYLIHDVLYMIRKLFQHIIIKTFCTHFVLFSLLLLLLLWLRGHPFYHHNNNHQQQHWIYLNKRSKCLKWTKKITKFIWNNNFIWCFCINKMPFMLFCFVILFWLNNDNQNFCFCIRSSFCFKNNVSGKKIRSILQNVQITGKLPIFFSEFNDVFEWCS